MHPLEWLHNKRKLNEIAETCILRKLTEIFKERLQIGHLSQTTTDLRQFLIYIWWKISQNRIGIEFVGADI